MYGSSDPFTSRVNVAICLYERGHGIYIFFTSKSRRKNSNHSFKAYAIQTFQWTNLQIEIVFFFFFKILEILLLFCEKIEYEAQL